MLGPPDQSDWSFAADRCRLLDNVLIVVDDLEAVKAFFL
jgi:hypothetical protein